MAPAESLEDLSTVTTTSQSTIKSSPYSARKPDKSSRLVYLVTSFIRYIKQHMKQFLTTVKSPLYNKVVSVLIYNF